MHHWSYLDSSLAGETQEGPIPEAEFISLVKQGRIKPKTKVVSMTRTKGQWIEARQFPAVNKLFEQLKADKLENKRLANEEKQQKKLIAKQGTVQSIEPAEFTPGQVLPPPAPVQPIAIQVVAPQAGVSPTVNTQIVINQRESNAIGMAGFVMSLFSILTCGILFPLGALFSLIGVFFKPRGFAVAGLIISGGACVVFVLAWVSFLGAMIMGVLGLSAAIDHVAVAMQQATAQIYVRSFYEDNGRIPDQDEYLDLFEGSEASIPEAVRLERVSDTTARFVHRGVDGEFGTQDDIEDEVDFTVDTNETTGDDENL